MHPPSIFECFGNPPAVLLPKNYLCSQSHSDMRFQGVKSAFSTEPIAHAGSPSVLVLSAELTWCAIAKLLGKLANNATTASQNLLPCLCVDIKRQPRAPGAAVRVRGCAGARECGCTGMRVCGCVVLCGGLRWSWLGPSPGGGVGGTTPRGRGWRDHPPGEG